MPIPLENRGEDGPSGPDLEYDPIFTDLTLAAEPGQEQQFGKEVIPATGPDYGVVIEKAHDVLSRSHDLRAAILLGEAELYSNGLTGFAEVTHWLVQCLTEYWDSCHPQLDAEDDDDPTMRINAVRNLAAIKMQRGLRLAPLTQSRQFGRICLRDIEIAQGDIDPPNDSEAVQTEASIAAAFRDTERDGLEQLLVAARQIADDLAEIDRIFSEHTPGQGPDLKPIADYVGRICDRLAAETGADADVGEEPVVAEAAGQPSAPEASGARGPIKSQSDVAKLLEEIIGYYAKHEPSSPLPVLLKRARRLVGADFMTIMGDLAPGGVNEMRVLSGEAPPESDY
ncbi:type VI secretion system protein TssA [Pseudooceanicola sp. C21-150M6]|uniref:type VI secretion system protein TssA n=1 Tax=Pseudooceanicola sp. C21-150M6 TaxID=3434355 RepID=UPI003D7F8CDB